MNNLEQIFAKSVGGILDQGCQASKVSSLPDYPEHFGCAYRQEVDGKLCKCAAGHLIPDEDYHSEMEGKYVPDYHSSFFKGPVAEYFMARYNNEELGLISHLQKIHDNSNRFSTVEEMKPRFLKAYKLFNLNIPDLESRLKPCGV